MDPGQVMLGINNRDLQTFKVDIDNNRRIMESSAGQQVQLPLATVVAPPHHLRELTCCNQTAEAFGRRRWPTLQAQRMTISCSFSSTYYEHQP